MGSFSWIALCKCFWSRCGGPQRSSTPYFWTLLGGPDNRSSSSLWCGASHSHCSNVSELFFNDYLTRVVLIFFFSFFSFLFSPFFSFLFSLFFFFFLGKQQHQRTSRHLLLDESHRRSSSVLVVNRIVEVLLDTSWYQSIKVLLDSWGDHQHRSRPGLFMVNRILGVLLIFPIVVTWKYSCTSSGASHKTVLLDSSRGTASQKCFYLSVNRITKVQYDWSFRKPPHKSASGLLPSQHQHSHQHIGRSNNKSNAALARLASNKQFQ
jgi:hypothetical protein